MSLPLKWDSSWLLTYLQAEIDHDCKTLGELHSGLQMGELLGGQVVANFFTLLHSPPTLFQLYPHNFMFITAFNPHSSSSSFKKIVLNLLFFSGLFNYYYGNNIIFSSFFKLHICHISASLWVKLSFMGGPENPDKIYSFISLEKLLASKLQTTNYKGSFGTPPICRLGPLYYMHYFLISSWKDS